MKALAITPQAVGSDSGCHVSTDVDTYTLMYSDVLTDVLWLSCIHGCRYIYSDVL